MAPEEDQQERGKIVRRLEDEKLRIQREQSQFERDKTRAGANFEQQLAEVEAKTLRAQAAANDPSFGTELCFECWVETGERVRMTQQAAGRAEDVYRCRNDHQKRVQR